MPSQTILILAANPKGTSPRRLDQEFRDIQAGLQRSQQRDSFTIQSRWAVQPSDIRRAMLDYKPQIVHFSGQGDGEAGLIFEDRVGQPKLVSGEALASLFELFSNQVQCVVLNGGYSKKQAEAISQHIPYVIGMDAAISNESAIEFAVGFYDALGAGETVEFAYKLGCVAIEMDGNHEQQKPVLFKKESSPASTPAPTPPTPTGQPQPLSIFVSYTDHDESLREELDVHLSTLRRQGKIATLNDRAIEAGTEWDLEKKTQLETADIILLLISQRFIASKDCYDVEMKRAMERHTEGTARVIPILLKPADWKDTPFSKLAPLPTNTQPITQWSDRDEAFVHVVQGIRRAVDSLQAKK